MSRKTLIEAAQGCDLLIPETFLPAETFAELMSFPIEKARMVVNEAHTPLDAAGWCSATSNPRWPRCGTPT